MGYCLLIRRLISGITANKSARYLYLNLRLSIDRIGYELLHARHLFLNHCQFEQRISSFSSINRSIHRSSYFRFFLQKIITFLDVVGTF